MPRWASNQNTGRTFENCEAHPDKLPCPSCNSIQTKFRFFNNKKTSQPRYQCSDCKKLWTAGGRTRAPYNKRMGGMASPEVADTASQPPAEPAATAPVRRSPGNQVKEEDPKDMGLRALLSLFLEQQTKKRSLCK